MMLRLALLLSLLALPTIAQVSLEELDAAADESDAAMTAVRERLNDPDPDRALAVLEILITRGDAAQKRLAVRHGLSSTDRAVRATALKAIFDAEPILRAVFVPVSEEPSVYYYRGVRDAGGVVNAEGHGSVTFKLNGYDAENACWTYSRSKSCILRMRGDAVSLWFGGSWGSYVLDGGTGKLMGEQEIAKNLAKASIDLSE